MKSPSKPSAENGIVISCVLPVLNEEENLPAVLEELRDCLKEKVALPFEILVVDDGSRDKSPMIARDWSDRHPEIRLLELRRNFGQTAAIRCGIDHAQGELIILMDADGQNDPADIPALLSELEKGCDIVSGWRRHRQDAFFTRILPSRAANLIISVMTGVGLHDYGCTLKVYRREFVENLELFGEMHRFIPALASWYGARIAEIPVNHRPRRHGRSKYGLNRIHKVFLDLLAVKFLIGYSTRPMRVFGALGLLTCLAGLVSGTLAAYGKIALGWDLTNHAITILTVLFFLIGMQLVTLGLMAEIGVRTYYRAADLKTYTLRAPNKY